MFTPLDDKTQQGQAPRTLPNCPAPHRPAPHTPAPLHPAPQASCGGVLSVPAALVSVPTTDADFTADLEVDFVAVTPEPALELVPVDLRKAA